MRQPRGTTQAAACAAIAIIWSLPAAGQGTPDAARVDGLIRQLNVSWDMAEQVKAQKAYEQLLKLGPAVVPACLRAISEGNGSARMWAAAALAQTRDPRGMEPMLKLLHDPEQKVRMVASYHIHVFIRQNPAVAAALGGQLADPDPDVREQAMKVLRKAKPPAALSSIRKALHSPELEARADALRMVLAYQRKNPATEIPKIVHSGQDGHLRSAATWVWPTVGKADVDLVLGIVALVNDTEPLVAEAALRLLHNFFKEPSLRGDDMGRMVAAAKAAMGQAAKNVAPKVREQAMPLLGHLSREAALPTLAHALRHDPDANVRVAAAQGLVRTRRIGARVLGPLLESLGDPTPEVRATCLRLIGALAKKDEMPPKYRSALAKQLAEQADKILQDPDPTVRAPAYVALAEVLRGRVADALVKAVQSEPDADARKSAVVGLYASQRRDLPALVALVAAMGDADPGVNAMAAKVVRKLLGKGVSDDALRDALKGKLRELACHQDGAIRANALPILGAVVAGAALDVILPAVRGDPEPAGRKAALDALARTRSRAAVGVDAVIAALRDEDTAVREFAYKVFAYLTRQRLPFDPKGKPEAREREVAAIEQWWGQQPRQEQ